MTTSNKTQWRSGSDPASGFLVAVAGLAVVVGWVSEWAQGVAAPWLLFPLAQGAVLALGIGAIARWRGVGRPRWLLPLAALTALAACAIQHHAAFLRANRRDAPRDDSAARLAFPEHGSRLAPAGLYDFLNRQAAVGRPLPAGLLARGGWAWASWAVDASIVAAATVLGVRWSASASPVAAPPQYP